MITNEKRKALTTEMKSSSPKVKKQKRKSLQNQKGQSMLEYVILTSLIGIFCLVGVRTFGQRLKHKITKMNSKIANEIKISN